MDEHTKACLRAMLDKKQMQRESSGKWEDASPEQVFAYLACKDSIGVRIKPESMCELAGVQYPMPMQEAPEVFSDVWMVSLSGEGGAYELEWTGGEDCMRWLAANVLHATKEAAEAHSQAMRAVNAQAHSQALRAVNAQAVAKAKEQA